MDRDSVFQLLLPELRSFPTDAARRSALEAALSSRNRYGVNSHPEVVGMLLLVPAGALLLSLGTSWLVWTMPVLIPICACTLGALAYRARVRRSLRDMLAKLERFCRCGYNLTGNVSGRCPECGQEVALPADGRHDPQGRARNVQSAPKSPVHLADKEER